MLTVVMAEVRLVPIEAVQARKLSKRGLQHFFGSFLFLFLQDLKFSQELSKQTFSPIGTTDWLRKLINPNVFLAWVGSKETKM